MPAQTRKSKHHRKKRVAGSSDNLRFIGMQETAYLQREIDGLDEELAQLQLRFDALYQVQMESEFEAYNCTVLKELYAMALVAAGIPLPNPAA